MPTKQVIIDTTVILTALADVGQPAPESHIYLALNSDMGRFDRAKSLLISLGLVVPQSYHHLALTQEGKEMAAKLQAILDSAKSR